MLLLLRVLKRARSSANQFETSPGCIVVCFLRQGHVGHMCKFGEKAQEPLLQAFDHAATWDRVEYYDTTKLLSQLFVTEMFKFVPPSLAVFNCANSAYICYGYRARP